MSNGRNMKIKKLFIQTRCLIAKISLNRAIKRYNKLKLKQENFDEKQLYNTTDQGKEQLFRESYIKSKAYIAIAVGVCLLILSFFIGYILNTKNDMSGEVVAILTSISTTLSSIVSIVIGLGIGTLVLDFFGYINYTRDRIKEVMLDKKYIKTLSDAEKEKLISDAESSLYFEDGNVVDNSLYENIKQQITPLIQKDYMKQYTVHVDCHIDEKKKCIEKTIKKTMEIICHKDGTSYQLPFSNYLTKIDGVDGKDLYKIVRCTCNKTDVTTELKDKIQEIEPDNQQNKEDIKFTLNHAFTLNKGLNIITIETKTMVPSHDNTYSHIISEPCQKYDVSFCWDNNDYEVVGFAFAIDTENSKNELKQVVFKNKYKMSYDISVKDWTLPGEGCVFVINKKA